MSSSHESKSIGTSEASLVELRDAQCPYDLTGDGRIQMIPMELRGTQPFHELTGNERTELRGTKSRIASTG